MQHFHTSFFSWPSPSLASNCAPKGRKEKLSHAWIKSAGYCLWPKPQMTKTLFMGKGDRSKLGDTKTYPSGFPRQGRTLQILSAPLSGLWKGPGDQATAFPKCAAWCWGESGTRWMKMLKNFLPFLMWLFLDWEFIWLLWCLTDFHSSYKVILAILRCLFNVLLGEQEPGTC